MAASGQRRVAADAMAKGGTRTFLLAGSRSLPWPARPTALLRCWLLRHFGFRIFCVRTPGAPLSRRALRHVVPVRKHPSPGCSENTLHIMHTYNIHTDANTLSMRAEAVHTLTVRERATHIHPKFTHIRFSTAILKLRLRATFDFRTF